MRSACERSYLISQLRNCRVIPPPKYWVRFGITISDQFRQAPLRGCYLRQQVRAINRCNHSYIEIAGAPVKHQLSHAINLAVRELPQPAMIPLRHNVLARKWD